VSPEPDKAEKKPKSKKTEDEKQSEAEFTAAAHVYGFMMRLPDWTTKLVKIIYYLIRASKFSADFNCECESYAIDKIFKEKKPLIIAWRSWEEMLQKHAQIMTLNLKEIVGDVEKAYAEAKIEGIDAQDECMGFMTMISCGIADIKAELEPLLVLAERKDITPETFYTYVNAMGYEAVVEKVTVVSIMESLVNTYLLQ